MINQAARLLSTARVPSKPSKPGRPVVECAGSIAVGVEWTRPEDDGRAYITGYLIKYGYKREGFLDLVHNYDTVKVVGSTTNFTYDQLKKDTEYHFAVAAENIAGQGEFSEFSDYISIGKY